MKALIFKLKGDYARFRCPYSTTSALSYSSIHPIAVKGLIGAIMGIDYSELFEYSKDIKIGIQVLNQVKKDTQSFNLVPMIKNNGSPTFPSRIEFLRDVSYRIFVNSNESKLNDIKDVLINRNYTFTPYLGVSEYIAKLEYEDIVNVDELKEEKGYVDSIILSKNFEDNDEKLNISLDRLPVKNSESREYTKYEKVAFIPGKKIYANLENIKKVGEYYVYFF